MSRTASTRWGILGPGNIARAFATGLAAIDAGTLVAVGSRDVARSRAFGERFGVDRARCHGSYDALVADPAVEAVYVATPHPWHREHATLALRAGRHVLCEKPAGMRAAEVEAVLAVAAEHERFFMEAFMYRSHPLVARLLEHLRGGTIGTPLHVDATFGFDVPRDPASRLFDRALGGGGILDVGCYPMSFARLVAGVAAGRDVDEPETLLAHGTLGPTGVDEIAHAAVRFGSGMSANLGCAISRALGSRVTVRGERGSLVVANDCWIPGARGGDVDARLEIVPDEGEPAIEKIPHRLPLYAYEADAASRAIADGRREPPSPAPTHADTLGNARALDRWRAAIGYVAVGDAEERDGALS